MKPQLLRVHLRPEQTFGFRNDVVPYFYNQWHYHEEIELVLILRGSGKQFIGNHIHNFKKGDMVLVGANLPHLWQSEDKYSQKKSKSGCEAYVIHFRANCFGDNFFNLPENSRVKDLLIKAKRGIRIFDPTRSAIHELMVQLKDTSGAKRIILLLEVLQCLAESKYLKTISSESVFFDFNVNDEKKLNNIYQYILSNFTKPITLSEVASIAHLSPNSFCRYFKSKIKISFSTFLIQIRIEHACKLLAETDKVVSEICYECGYNNFSNFNRHFRNMINRTPIEHRKYYQKLDDHRII